MLGNLLSFLFVDVLMILNDCINLLIDFGFVIDKFICVILCLLSEIIL